MFKGDVRQTSQIFLCDLIPVGQGMAFSDVNAGRDGRNFVKIQIPGIQQTANDLLCQFGEKDDTDVRR